MSLIISETDKEILLNIFNDVNNSKVEDVKQCLNHNKQAQQFFEHKNKRKIKIEEGLFKQVLFPSHKNYVIKFIQQNVAIDKNDFEEENRIKEAAAAFNLSHLFAENLKICSIDKLGDGIYVQKKATFIGSHYRPINDNQYYEYENTANKLKEKLLTEEDKKFFDDLIINSDVFWLKEVEEYIGAAAFHNLLLLLKQEKIKDLHSYNVGYFKNMPIIFDYSY